VTVATSAPGHADASTQRRATQAHQVQVLAGAGIAFGQHRDAKAARREVGDHPATRAGKAIVACSL
jgi:uncharacterized protein YfiM (DUF2279 family)